MRSSCCTALICTVILTSPARSEERFSAGAIALLEQITNSFDLNGTRMPPGPFDKTVLTRLAKADQPQVRAVAEMAPELKLLHTLNRLQGKAAAEKIGERAGPALIHIGKYVIEGLTDSREEKDDLRAAVKTLEEVIDSKTQEEVNKAWAIACLGNGVGVAMKAQLRDLATSGQQPGGKEWKGIAVALGTAPTQFGAIAIKNRTRRTLHHCLVITRLEADRERLKTLAAQEDAVGEFILPALGFSKRTVDGSRLAARLRYLFCQQDKGVVVYVPELAPGATLTTTLADPKYFRVAKGADVSFWCDEGSIEHCSASNWARVRAAVLGPSGRGSPALTPPPRK